MRQGLAVLLALAPAFAAGAQSSDPAYVDSPQSKASADPARADHHVGGSVERQRYVEDTALAQRDAERLAEAERNIEAQIERFSAQQAATMQQQDSRDPVQSDDVLPPVGGRSLIREVRGQASPMQQSSYDAPLQPARSQPGPARQVGSALLQDGAGLLDAHIQQAIRGDARTPHLPDPLEPRSRDSTPGP